MGCGNVEKMGPNVVSARNPSWKKKVNRKQVKIEKNRPEIWNNIQKETSSVLWKNEKDPVRQSIKHQK